MWHDREMTPEDLVDVSNSLCKALDLIGGVTKGTDILVVVSLVYRRPTGTANECEFGREFLECIVRNNFRLFVDVLCG